jgi:hypothetical protein
MGSNLLDDVAVVLLDIEYLVGDHLLPLFGVVSERLVDLG